VEFQEGILASRQAQAAGLSRDVLRSRVRHGRWQRMYSGVYAVFSGQPGRAAVLWAAVLRVGPGAMLSYRTAAELAQLTDTPSALIHVTVPVSRRIGQIPGLVVHISSRAAEARHPALAPARTRLEETVLDLAQQEATLDAALGWVTRAVGRRLTTGDRLRAAMESRSRLRRRQELEQALTPEWYGVHSNLEYRYLRDVERPHSLPRGTRQARLDRGGRREYRDVWYQRYGVAVELDGRAAHPGDTRWADIRRDNAAAADGIMTLRYGWLDVTQQPCLVAAQLARLLQQRGYTEARPCAPGCPVGIET
jgi:hypothetical protein